ncbi:MAG TPA: alpha/beta hydrolase [Solirubrobacterales bacterium]|jgi:pimeloyl-ACP methyl ester carboxylesterase|nr:alpha/beta hydrolase [Solirubrobacterales bacterium]
MYSFGEERMAPANGIELCYQEMGDPEGQPLVLVMGLATQMIAWHEGLCRLLAGRGYRVIRFDNRDIGRSTKLDRAGVPSKVDLLLGRRASAPYLLRDMAADVVGLLDSLEIDQAHVVGASMGGMIVQQMAIDHPRRLRSMVSIMSTTGNRRSGQPSLKTFGILLGDPPKGRDQVISRAVRTFKVIGSPGFPFEEDTVREMAGRSYERGHSAAGVLRQLHAIVASGDRTKDLHRVQIPAAVIHGTRDPLVKPSGGKATARAIPGARLMMIDGMGHDLPRDLWPTFAAAIDRNAARANRGDAITPAEGAPSGHGHLSASA